MPRTGSVSKRCSSKRRSTLRVVVRRLARAWCGVPYLLVLLSVSTAHAQGLLDTMRDSVRLAPPPSTGDSSSPSRDRDDDRDDHDHHSYHDDDCDDDSDWGGLYLIGGYLFVAGVTSPWWGPHVALGDDFAVDAYFPRFPYDDDVPGYMVAADWPARSLYEKGLYDAAFDPETDHISLDPMLARFKQWSARLRAEYADDSEDISRIGGHLLLSTTSRWGLDMEMNYLQENLPGGRRDQLWNGDCNVIFRFAQSEHMQWRTGLCFNWLDDETTTNFGFNFTYGMDYFPARPWVFSSTLDWGNLGRAEQFRFRTTAGVLIWGLESYVGYEYYDLDETQINSLIGGVRIWF